MNVSLFQEHLTAPLSFVGKNIAAKAQLPIIQTVLLSADKGQLRLATTNMETTTAATIAVKTEKSGGICVPSKLFMDFVLSLPKGKIELSEKNMQLTVRSGGYKATLPGMDQSEFPPVPERSGVWEKVPAKEFLSSVKSVLYAAAADEGRPVLTGVKIQKKGKETLFVATDGYRLSLKKTELSAGGDMESVIPARALSHLLLAGQDGDIEFGETKDGQIGFSAGDYETYTRRIEGEYPAFERIIPKSNTTTVSMKKEALLRAVKTAAIFAKDNANIVRFRFEKTGSSVSANTPQVGESEAELETEVEGDGGEIAFNSRFVLEFLGNTDAEGISFEMTGSLNPGVFKVEGDDSFLHIIMPVRVKTE